jgi:hypothetical protein
VKRSPTPGCREFLERLSLYAGGELTPKGRRLTGLHVEHCACCHDLADDLRDMIALCRAAGRRFLPAAERLRAKARIAELLDRTEEASRRLRRPRKPPTSAEARRSRRV